MKSRLLISLLAFAGVALLAKGLWIPAKAELAQFLLRSAWKESLAGGGEARPWPWADTYPVAQLGLPTEEEIIVLSGASGRTMAFGPGHVDGTASPGSSGNCVITAHRDTHFTALQHLKRGDDIVMTSADRKEHHYRVERTMIVHERETTVLDPELSDRLTLITCYPFDAIVPGGPLRYVVIARLEG